MKNQKTKNELDILNIQEILKKIPHRYPMLLIDKVIEIKKNKSAIGIKNVTANENFFTGHFPNQMIMPGVLIIESMAQTAAVMVVESLGSKAEGSLVYFLSIDRGRFRKPVIPGDQLMIHTICNRRRNNVWRFGCKAFVEDEVVAEATISAMIMAE